MKKIPPLVIGLLGGIGSGKTATARWLERRHGATILSADHWGHEALRQPAILRAVRRRWPGVVTAGRSPAVDRPRLAALVFSRPTELRTLNALVHPWIRRALQKELRAAVARGKRLFVLDAAILVEMGLSGLCRLLVFVDAPAPLRARRVARDRGWSLAEWRRREKSQWPLARKKALAHFILFNRGTPRELSGNLERWWAFLAATREKTIAPKA